MSERVRALISLLYKTQFKFILTRSATLRCRTAKLRSLLSAALTVTHTLTMLPSSAPTGVVRSICTWDVRFRATDSLEAGVVIHSQQWTHLWSDEIEIDRLSPYRSGVHDFTNFLSSVTMTTNSLVAPEFEMFTQRWALFPGYRGGAVGTFSTTAELALGYTASGAVAALIDVSVIYTLCART